ncbi:MAG: ABC transporter substrate-binding protein [Chloroflexota bacterium]|nr:MAG: ABC transporter substrate-binding protein [Chloroflexota bacterium]
MNKQSKVLTLLALLVISSMLLASCQPASTATPERIVETVIVTQIVEGTPQVFVTEVPVTQPATGNEGETTDTGFIAADEMVACMPLPEVVTPTTSLGSLHLASLAAQTVEAPVTDTAVSSPFGRQIASAALQEGGEYRVGVFEDVTTLNYFAANGPDNTVWNSYMLPPRLSMYGLSQVTFTLVPNLATPVAPDPLVQEGEFWVTTVPMRNDVTWSDGEPFTAADVAFTANTVLEFGLISGNWSTWYDGDFLDHVEAVDDTTVKYFYHTKPGLGRHEYGTLQAPILAEHYWAPVVEEAIAPVRGLAEGASEEDLAAAQAEAQDALFAHVPDGEPTAGAFTLERWEQGAFLDVAANPDYYETGKTINIYENGAYSDSEGVAVGTPEGEPLSSIEIGPHVTAVVYTIYGSQDAAILALKNGEVDFVLNSLGLQRGLANQIQTDPNLTVVENPTNGFRYLSFNNRRRPMNDCAFRQAVSVLIDKEFVTQNILQGVAFPLYTYVPEGNETWYFPDVPKLGEGMDRQQRLNYAMAILEQAGYTWENDNKPTFDEEANSVVPGAGRLIMPDGTPVPQLTLIAPSAGYDPLRSTFAIWIETWLNEFGIPVTAELSGFNVLVPRIFTEQDFDMYILGWSLGIFPDFLYDFFASEQAAPDGNNAGGYISEDFETLSQTLLTCETLEDCKVISDQIQTLLATESPYVVLFDTGIIEAYSNVVEFPYSQQLSGLQYTHQGGGTLQSEVRVR